MRCSIEHTLNYHYSQPVFLEPLVLRLRPREDGRQIVEDFHLHIDPTPAGHTQTLDAHGNIMDFTWFVQTTPTLMISAHSTVRTSEGNPFNFLLDDQAITLPITYAPTDYHQLTAALTRRPHPSGTEDRVAGFARQLLEECGGQTLAFLSLLNHRLYERTKIVIREEGEPYQPLHTFDHGVGACRDVTELFTDACRVVGIAARFVSGYQEGDPDTTQRHLHAWAEVYVPHAGWRGFDPTLGLAVGSGHVAIAAAANYTDAAPVTGTFRRTGATSQMTYNLRININR